jgi:hypothetical protein
MNVATGIDAAATASIFGLYRLIVFLQWNTIFGMVQSYA